MTNQPTRSILLTTVFALIVAAFISATDFLPPAAAGIHEGRQKKIASQLLERHSVHSSAEETANVVVQLRRGNRGGVLRFLNANGIRLSKEFKNLDSVTVELPVRLLRELAAFNDVHFVSGDEEVFSFGHVSSTTGADDVRSVMPNGHALDGTGLGIAIVDSGIYPSKAHYNDPNVVCSMI